MKINGEVVRISVKKAYNLIGDKQLTFAKGNCKDNLDDKDFVDGESFESILDSIVHKRALNYFK
jgi:hypothetical protein